MRSTPIYEVHAVKSAHVPRKAWEVQITPDPHDADAMPRALDVAETAGPDQR